LDIKKKAKKTMQTQQPVIVLGRSLSLVNAIAEALFSYKNNNVHGELSRIHQLESFLPRGSGIDSGTKIDLDKSQPDKIILTFDYHHMNEDGFYDGWSCDWKAIITPTFLSYIGLHVDLKTGRFNDNSHRRRYNDSNFKDYLHETYYYCLDKQIVHGYDQTNHEVVYYWLQHAKEKFPDSNLWKD
jgi:hypothetical protein